MKPFCYFFMLMGLLSCAENKQTNNFSTCDCSTSISQFSTWHQKNTDSLLDRNLYLVMQEILPSNVGVIDLSDSIQYKSVYKNNKDILNIKSDSSFSFKNISGKWTTTADGLIFYQPGMCGCDPNKFLGVSSIAHIKSSGLIKFEHTYHDQTDTVRFSCKFFFSTDSAWGSK